MAGKGSLTSKFLAKHGTKVKTSHTKHKGDKKQLPSGGGLPANVEGVAKLTEIGIIQIGEGKKNAGEFMLSAAGIVLKPSVFIKPDGVKVKTQGQRTSIIMPLFPTTKGQGKDQTQVSFDENYALMLNQLQLLGADPKEFDGEDLDAVFEALKQSAPKFNFRTWGGPSKEYPNSSVKHTWGDLYDGDDIESGSEEGGDAEDESEAAEGEEGEGDADAEEATDEGGDAEEATDEEATDEEATEEEVVEEPKKKVTVKKDPPKKEAPEVGEILYFAPLDPKTKQPGKKKVEVEVKKIDKAAKKVDIVLVDDNSKGWKNIAFDRLSSSSK